MHPTPESAPSSGQPLSLTPDDTLIVYFSFTGNTEAVARVLHRQTGLPLAAIERPQAIVLGLEEDEGPEPQEIADVELGRFGTLLLGFPVWAGQLPSGVEGWLDDTDLSGKTILPFCTHGGDGAGKSFEEVAQRCPASKVLPGLALLGGIEEDGVMLPMEDEQLAEVATRFADWLGIAGDERPAHGG